MVGNHPQQQQQQQLLYQHQLQQRQQQMLLLQQLQKQQQQQQQQAAMSRFPSNIDVHLRPPGLIQNRPINPPLQNPNPNTSSGPNLGQQHTPNFQQQQQIVSSQQMLQQQQQQQQKVMRPLNHIELQFAYQDAWRVCHPDFKRPFSSLEDACERLVVSIRLSNYKNIYIILLEFIKVASLNLFWLLELNVVTIISCFGLWVCAF